MDQQHYNEIQNTDKYTFNNKLYCHCVFEFKDKLKNLGFKWDNVVKKWYIEKNKFTLDIYEKSSEIRFTTYTTIGPCHYYYVFYQEKNKIQEIYDEQKKDFKPIKKTPKYNEQVVDLFIDD
jgi:hypothetical protein